MNRYQERDKAEIFVKHIENHISEMTPEQRGDGRVICKICNKTIDEIVKEETNKGIWIADGIYIPGVRYVDRNGKIFRLVEGQTEMTHSERIQAVEMLLKEGKTENDIVGIIKGFKWKNFDEEVTLKHIQNIKRRLE